MIKEDMNKEKQEIAYWKDELFECRINGDSELAGQCIEELRRLGAEEEAGLWQRG